ncbi:bestrophin family protein [Acidisoma sp. 7E03]
MIVSKGIHIGRLLRYNATTLAVLLAYDVAITAAYLGLDWHWVSIPALPLPLLGSAIALIVTIRNNAAYARWWEARTLWGSILNNSRSLARGVVALVDDAATVRDLVRAQIAYALALRCHLLRLPTEEVLARYLPAEMLEECRGAANVPTAVQMAISRRLAGLRRSGALDSVGVANLDRTLAALVDAQGGLERIKNTPLPRQYSALPLIFSRAYCFVLPLGMVDNLGLATPFGSALIGFMFLILNEIGSDLEDPFSNDVHDVPMGAITRTIEIDLLQTIGATDVPPPITPVDGILI